MDTQQKQVGLITFKHPKQLTKIQIQASQGFQGWLAIDWGDYQRHHWNQLVKDITTIKAKQLHIWNNRYPSILKEITPILFPLIQTLNLRSNLICSIEPLINIKLSTLKQLDLSSNHITSAKTFAKLDARNLQVLCLKLNPVVNFEHLFKANFPKLKDIELSIESEYRSYYKMIPDLITWKIKLPTSLASDISHRNYEYGYTTRRGRQTIQFSWIKYKQQLHKKANKTLQR